MLVQSYLRTNHLPEPDLLIRTSGEVRMSYFMFWQLAYADLTLTGVTGRIMTRSVTCKR